MERDKNRKLKLLKLLEILQRETDEQATRCFCNKNNEMILCLYKNIDILHVLYVLKIKM